jgi:hypothetical protein
MSMKTCQECHYSIDTEMSRCPRCGSDYAQSIPIQMKGWGVDRKWGGTFYGYPLVHIAFGRDERGRFRVAKGVIAIGQFAIGLISIAQVGVGILFGLGQVMFGLTAIAQVAVTVLFAVGQLAVGYVAIGQIAVGVYVRCMVGLGQHVWSMKHQDPIAVQFFRQMMDYIIKK